ncbi:MAG: transposase [Phaeodactylibacter sp.]|nr:transposase [Phaeodactylibacter sp.]
MKRTQPRRGYSHYDAAHWADLLAGQARSGQSVKNYCQAQGVHPSSFYRWKKLLKPDVDSLPGFSPIQIQEQPFSYEVVVELPGGVLLRFAGLLHELFPQNWKPASE